MRSHLEPKLAKVQKKYIYSDHLQFLLKIAAKEETTTNYSKTIDECNESEGYPLSPVESLNSSSNHIDQTVEDEPIINLIEPEVQSSQRSVVNPLKIGQKRKKSSAIDRIENEILNELKRPQIKPSDHELLMSSFVPYLRDMSETELMDLQMDILSSIRRIKQARCTTTLSVIPNTSIELATKSQKQPAPSTSVSNTASPISTTQTILTLEELVSLATAGGPLNGDSCKIVLE